MVPYFKYMPSYDDITISTSHSLIQFHSHETVQREYGEYEIGADGCVRVTETPSQSKHITINAIQGSHRERRGLKGKTLGPLLAKMPSSSGGSPKQRIVAHRQESNTRPVSSDMSASFFNWQAFNG
jgi:hypothetical protein